MTATCTPRPASRASTSGTPGCARAASGSATIGASVPSKSNPSMAVPGDASSAANPARPASVVGCGNRASGEGMTFPAIGPDLVDDGVALDEQQRVEPLAQLAGLGVPEPHPVAQVQ